MNERLVAACLILVAGTLMTERLLLWQQERAEQAATVLQNPTPLTTQPLLQAVAQEPLPPTNRFLTVTRQGVSEAELNQRFTGLLSHVRWLIDERTTRSSAADTPDERVDRLERQIFAFMDETHDDRSDLSEDLTEGGSFSEPTLSDTTLTGTTTAETLTTSRLGVGTTSPSDTLAVDGAVYLGDTTLTTTAARLYNTGGNLYWNGALLGGGAVGNWSANGGDVYRLTGNVGIGTSTPATELSVVGDFSLSGNILNATYQGSPITDAYVADNITASNYLSLADWAATTTDALPEGSTNRYSRWDINGTDLSYTGGNVGVGTSTADYTLHVVEGTPTNVGIFADSRIRASNALQFLASGGTVWQFANSGVNDAKIDPVSASDRTLSFLNSGAGNLNVNFNSGQVYIDSAGNVGIGTAIPNRKLHLKSSGDAWVKLETTAASGSQFLLGTDSANKFQIFDDKNNQFRLTVDNVGNVGIGTTSPSNKLTVYDTNTGGASLRVHAKGISQEFFEFLNTDDNTVMSLNQLSNGDPLFRMFTDAGTDIIRLSNQAGANITNLHELYIETAANGGNVGIGTSTPQTKLHVGGIVQVDGVPRPALQFRKSNTGQEWSLGAGAGNYFYIKPSLFDDDATDADAVFTIKSNGYVGIGTSTPTNLLYAAGTSGGSLAWDQTNNKLTVTQQDAVGNTEGIELADLSGNTLRFYFGGGNNPRIDAGTNQLVISSDVRFPDDNIYSFGSANDYAFSYNSTDTRFELTSTDVDGVGTNGDVFRIEDGTDDVSFMGRVGIGTTSPAASLAIGSGQLIVSPGSLASPSIAFSNDSDTGIYRNAANGFAFVGGGSLLADFVPTRFTVYAGQMRIPDGSRSFPGYSWKDDTDTGIYRSGADELTVSVGGTDAVTFASSGNVGIGSSTPSAKLSVVGVGTNDNNTAFAVADSADTTKFSITDGGLGTFYRTSGPLVGKYLTNQNRTTISFQSNSGSPRYFGANDNSDFVVYKSDGSTEQLVVANSGNVGIGTSTPTAPLSLSYNNSTVGNPLLLLNNEDTASAQSGFTFATAGDPVAQVRVDKGGAMVFASKKKQYFAYSNDYGQAIDIQFGSFADPFLVGDASTGNVGIGTTTPPDKLSVEGDVSFSEGSGYRSFYWDATNGRLGIGDTSPPNALSVSGDINLTSNAGGQRSLGVEQSGGGATDFHIFAGDPVFQPGTIGGDLFLYGGSGSQADGSVVLAHDGSKSVGNVGIGSTSPSAKLTVSGEAKADYFTAASTTATSTFAGDVQVTGNMYANAWYARGATNTSNFIGGNNENGDFRYLEFDWRPNWVDIKGSAGGINLVVWDTNFKMSDNKNVRFGSSNDFDILYDTALGGLHLKDKGLNQGLFIDNTTANVGIGTTSPNAKLDIWGDLQVGTSSTPTFSVDTAADMVNIGQAPTIADPQERLNIDGGVGIIGNIVFSDENDRQIRFDDSSPGGRSLSIFADDAAAPGTDGGSIYLVGGTAIGGDPGNVILAHTGTSAIGNVGIGLSSPSVRLHTDGGDVRFNDSGDNPGFYFDESTGRVGLGTSSPNARLTVDGDVRAPYFTAASSTETSTFAGNVSIASSKSYRIGGSPVLTDGGRTVGKSNANSNTGLAYGEGNTSSDVLAPAFGYGNTASGGVSSAFGYLNVAGDVGASAFGYGNTASSSFASAFGHDNTASGLNSSAFGYQNTTSGNYASAFGYSNTVIAQNASAIGKDITNGIADSLMIGSSNSAKATILSTGELQAPFFTATSTTATNTFAGDIRSNGAYWLNGEQVISGNNITNNTFSLGPNNIVDDGNAISIAIGAANTVSNPISFAFGYNNSITAGSAVAVGGSNTVGGVAAVAVGKSITNNTASSLMIGPSDAAKLTILGSAGSVGNVGIGTTTPSAKLTVVGNARADYFTAASTTATSTFAGGVDIGNGRFAYDHASGKIRLNAPNAVQSAVEMNLSASGFGETTSGISISAPNSDLGTVAIAKGLTLNIDETGAGSKGIEMTGDARYGFEYTSTQPGTFRGVSIKNDSVSTLANGAYFFNAQSTSAGFDTEDALFRGLYTGGSADGGFLRFETADETGDVFTVNLDGSVGIGTSTPHALLGMQNSIAADNAVGGIEQRLAVDANGGGDHYGNRTFITPSGSLTSATNIYGEYLSIDSSNCVGCSNDYSYGYYVEYPAATGGPGGRVAYYADIVPTNGGNNNLNTAYFAQMPGTSTAAVAYQADTGSNYTGKFIDFEVNNTDVMTVGSDGTLYTAGNVGIGSTTPNYKLSVAGNVYADSFIDNGTTIAAPDYVFDDPEYEHLTIEEIESFVEENAHLPWLTPRGPGAMSLTARINEVLEGLENLFLKVFELVDWNEEQDARAAALEERVAELEAQVEALTSGSANTANTAAASSEAAEDDTDSDTATTETTTADTETDDTSSGEEDAASSTTETETAAASSTASTTNDSTAATTTDADAGTSDTEVESTEATTTDEEVVSEEADDATSDTSEEDASTDDVTAADDSGANEEDAATNETETAAPETTAPENTATTTE